MHVTGNGVGWGQGLIAVKEEDTTTCVFVDKQICKALLTHQEEKDDDVEDTIWILIEIQQLTNVL